MPVKRLPKKLVLRLKKITEKRKQRNRVKQGLEEVHGNLSKMKNIDHRRNDIFIKGMIERNPDLVTQPGTRIRQMNVSRNFPKTKLAIKKVSSYANGKTELSKITMIVKNHNIKFKPKNYVLLEPKAYQLSKTLVAMAKTNNPNVIEILGSLNGGKTERGNIFFKKLSKKHKVTKLQLKKAFEKLQERTSTSEFWKLHKRNILLLGIKNGKFVFMPLVDYR